MPEIARHGRVGHKMPGIARVYEHVTPEMLRHVRDALVARWLGSVLAPAEPEREKLLSWVPKLRPAVEDARKAESAGEKAVSQSSPIGRSGGSVSGGGDAS